MGDRRASAGFGKSSRLLTAKDYSRVFDGCEARASHRHVLLLAMRNGGCRHRLGLVIARKHVRLACERNRIKRVTREFFRQLPTGDHSLDVVVLARGGIGELDNEQLSTILQHQWQKLMSHVSKTAVSTGRDS